MKKRYVILTLLCLCFLVASGYAHWWTSTFDHNPFTKFLELTTPTISCNISGWTLTKTTYYNADGSLNSTAWHNDPRDPVIKISSDGHGLGFAQVQF